MSLTATHTVTRLSDLSSVVFDDKDTNGNKTEYYAPSANGDLSGRLKLVVEHSQTKNGVFRSVVHLTEPVLDADSGEYSSSIKASLTLNRKGDHTLEQVTDVIKMLLDAVGPAADTSSIARDAMVNFIN